MNHSLLRNTYALLALVVATGCGLEPPSADELAEFAEAEQGAAGNGAVEVTSQAILNGTSVAGRKGVVALGFGTFQQSCTGVLIGPYHLLTAAHCTDVAGTRRNAGTMRRTVRYYDPAGGARYITAANEVLHTRVIDTWDGINNAGAFDYQDDLAVVTRRYSNGSLRTWEGTTSSDYQRIWVGSISTVDINTLYGAGYPEPSNAGLRSMGINIYRADKHWFYDLGGQRRTCSGDSGGPYLASVPDRNFAGGYVETVLGIHAGAERPSGALCASDGGRQYAARLNSRIAWIRTHTGHACPVDNYSVARCF